MRLIKNSFITKIILSIVLISLCFSSVFAPSAEATRLKLNDGDFYYSGTTKGTYEPPTDWGNWLINFLKEVVDFLLGIMTYGIRAVFLGWTALLEKILTWALESAAGIDEDIDNGTVSKTKSVADDNITVQAIVFNKVPILNVNIFDYDLSKFNEVSPTGLTDPSAAPDTVTYDDNNTVMIIKKAVAEWYYILRYVAIAFMLIVLIFVGIKMAISTISKDKALYKRMLIDWVVGFLLLFFMHYFMIAIIDFNEVLLRIVETTPFTAGTEMDKKELDDTAENKRKQNEEVELSIYDEIRTRAYDPKLTNGTLGTIFYMVMVYYAYRFTLVYLKRYLVIVVLTLLAPAVAVSYAFTKSMTGKGTFFSTWLNEYIVNIIIQPVHAILYSSFVSIALSISLINVSGMFLSFVILHFMLKADIIFRKIFNLSGKAGLAGDVGENTSYKQLLEGFKAGTNAMLGGKIGKELAKKSPITKLAMKPAKFAGRNLVYLASKASDKYGFLDYQKKFEDTLKQVKDSKKQLDEYVSENQEYDRLIPVWTASRDADKALLEEKIEQGYDESDDEYREIEDRIKSMDERIENAKQAKSYREKDIEKLQKRLGKLNKKQQKKYDRAVNMTTGFVIARKLQKFLDYNNYSEWSEEKQKRVRLKNKKKSLYGLKWLKVTENSLDAKIRENLKSENLLGLSSKDKQILKESSAFLKKGLIGFFGTFFGLPLMIAEPAIGLPMLSMGISNSIDIYGSNGNHNISGPRLGGEERRYSFNRFSAGSIKTISEGTIEQANIEKDEMVVNNVKYNHTKLYKAIMTGAPVSVTTLKGVGLLTLGVPIIPAAIGVFNTPKATQTLIENVFGNYRNYANKVDYQHFKQLRKLQEEMEKDEVYYVTSYLTREYSDSFNDVIESYNQEVESMTDEELQKEENIERGISVDINGEELKISDSSNVKIEETIIKNAIKKYAKSRGKGDLSKIPLDEITIVGIERELEADLQNYGIISKVDKVSDVIDDVDSKISICYKELESGEIGKLDVIDGDVSGRFFEEKDVEVSEHVLQQEFDVDNSQQIILDTIIEQLQINDTTDVRALDSDQIREIVLERFNQIKESNRSESSVKTEEVARLLMQEKEKVSEESGQSLQVESEENSNREGRQQGNESKQPNNEYSQKKAEHIEDSIDKLIDFQLRNIRSLNENNSGNGGEQSSKKKETVNREELKQNAKQRRMEKLQQILETAALEGEDHVIEEVKSAEVKSSDEIVEMLLLQKAIKEENLEAVELKIPSKKPNRRYLNQPVEGGLSNSSVPNYSENNVGENDTRNSGDKRVHIDNSGDRKVETGNLGDRKVSSRSGDMRVNSNRTGDRKVNDTEQKKTYGPVINIIDDLIYNNNYNKNGGKSNG